MHICTKTRALSITFSLPHVSALIAPSSGENFFSMLQTNMSPRAPTRTSNNTIGQAALAKALYLADRTKLERGWEHATRNVEQRWLVPSPRQCPCSHGLECAVVFGKKHDDYTSSSLFTRPCGMRLLPIPSYDRPDERETFCWCQRSEKEKAGVLEQHQHWRVPEMFSAVGKKRWYKCIGSNGEHFEGD